MKFSVLISVYHKENAQYLAEALESITERQTLLPDEIVLVKDGALTPAIDEVISNYTEKYPQIFKIVALPENLGLGKALNEGLKYASNEWIFRMDSDDIAFPERFEQQSQFIAQNPSVVLFSSHIAEFSDSVEHILSYRKVPIGDKHIKRYALKRSPFNHMTVAFKKSVIQAVGGYRHHLYLEDYNLWLRVIAAGYEVGNLDSVLLYARAGNTMIGRRRGSIYVQSEWQLYLLKQQLKLQNPISGFFLFLLRAVPRMLPTKLLEFIYKFLRN